MGKEKSLSMVSDSREVQMERSIWPARIWPWRCSATGWLARGLGGATLFGSMLLSLPLTAHHLAQFQALNRELGKLCGNPPRQALTVCRLHARLVNTL